MIIRHLFYATSVLTLLISYTGCAAGIAHVCGGLNCEPLCHEKKAVAKVNVGGQVYEPRNLDIGDEGLTLQAALMSVGGARETLAIATVSTASDAAPPAKIKELASVAMSIGKHKAHETLYLTLGAEAKEFVTQSSDDVNKTVDEFSKSADALIVELSSSYATVELEMLRDFGLDLGYQMELLALYGNAKLREKVAWDPEVIEKAISDLGEQVNMIMAGFIDGTQKTSARFPGSDLFVALERPREQPPVTYYFPYDLVLGGQAGEIQLRDGDAINVVDVRNTELNPANGQLGGAGGITIQGYVEGSGIADGILTIGGLHAQSQRTIDDARSVWMLVRPSPGGEGQRVFVLPDRLVTSGGVASLAPTFDGDAYTYTILPQVPIVLETLLVRTVGPDQQKCLHRLHQAVKQHHQDKRR